MVAERRQIDAMEIILGLIGATVSFYAGDLAGQKFVLFPQQNDVEIDEAVEFRSQGVVALDENHQAGLQPALGGAGKLALVLAGIEIIDANGLGLRALSGPQPLIEKGNFLEKFPRRPEAHVKLRLVPELDLAVLQIGQVLDPAWAGRQGPVEAEYPASMAALADEIGQVVGEDRLAGGRRAVDANDGNRVGIASQQFFADALFNAFGEFREYLWGTALSSRRGTLEIGLRRHGI